MLNHYMPRYTSGRNFYDILNMMYTLPKL